MKNLILSMGILMILMCSCGTTKESANTIPDQISPAVAPNADPRFQGVRIGPDSIPARQGVTSREVVTSNKAGRRN